jgi:hypothetical protein
MKFQERKDKKQKEKFSSSFECFSVYVYITNRLISSYKSEFHCRCHGFNMKKRPAVHRGNKEGHSCHKLSCWMEQPDTQSQGQREEKKGRL